MEGGSGTDIVGGAPSPHRREDLRNARAEAVLSRVGGRRRPLPARAPAGRSGQAGLAGEPGQPAEPAGRAGPGRAGAARRCAERRRRGAQGEGRARRPSGGGGARAGAGAAAAAAAADSGPSKQARLPRPGGPRCPPRLRARPLLGPSPEPAPRAGAAAAAAAEALSFPARRLCPSAAETDPGAGARAEAAAAAAAWGFVHGGPGPCARAATRKSFRSPSSPGASGPEYCSIWSSLAWPHAPTHPPQGSAHRARAWDQSHSDQAQALNI